MYKVEKRDEKLAESIVNSKSDMSFAGVLVGNNPGEVWVDNLENPKAAIVYYQGQRGFQFMGDFTESILHNSLEDFIDTTAKEFLKGKADSFDFSFDDEGLSKIAKDILKDRKIEEFTQFVYKLPGHNQTEIDPLESAFIIDGEFISSISAGNVNNADFILNYLKEWWGTAENYLNHGHGFAKVLDDNIVSFAISSSAYDNIQAIGVETLENYRKQGLAASLTRNLLETFREKGIKPWWDCYEKNIPSQKTAEKNGLVLNFKYSVYSIKY